jgi:outer membrane immunogenic protein
MRRFGSAFVKSVLVVAAAGVTASMALAADLPVPAAAPAYYPPLPAHYNWSGPYIGGHVGGGLLEDLVTYTTTTGVETAGTTTKLSPYALVGGPQAGFNLEFAPIVVGIEATWTSSAISGNYAIPALAAGTQAESRSAPNWFATLTGRLGYAANDLLFYAKGGVAYTHVDYTQISLAGGVVNGPQQTIIDNREGFTVGGGVEYAFNENLSAKLEYDFLDFGTKNYNFTAMNAGAGLPVSIKSDVHLLTAGLNYRYNLSGIFGQY